MVVFLLVVVALLVFGLVSGPSEQDVIDNGINPVTGQVLA